MNASDLTFLGGLLLGLASSLHCAGMCGGIASSLIFTLAPSDGRWNGLRVLLIAQSARISVYVGAGGILGTVGSAFYGAFDQAVAYQVLQWAAAATLSWIGLSLIGFAPALSGIDKIVAPLSRRLYATRAPKGFGPAIGALATGTIWGLLPCGMVYGVLFYAMLTGSGPGGALVMVGFGLGTLPSVTASAFGLFSLQRLARGPRTRRCVGAALIIVAFASLAAPRMGLAGLCII